MPVKRKRARVSAISFGRVKSTLAKAGVPATEIRRIVESLKREAKVAALQKRRGQIAKRIAKIDKQIAALGGKVSKPSAAKRTRKKTLKRKRAAVRQVSPQKVLDFLKKNKTKSCLRADIAKGLAVRSPALSKAINGLLAGKKIKKKGQRRGTRYYV